MKRISWFVFAFFALVSLKKLVAQDSRMQTINAMGISTGFASDQTKQTVDQVATNVLRLANNTTKTLEIVIQFTHPVGWKLLGLATRTYTMEAGDSLFVPLRVIPDKNANGNTTYLINALVSSKGVGVANSTWNVSIERLSDWHASLSERKVYFQSESDSANFEVQVYNKGNSDELLVIELSPGPDINLTDVNGNPVSTLSRSFIVPVGGDTTMTFKVERKKMDVKPTESSFMGKEQRKQYSVRVVVRNERAQSGGRRWNATAEFVKVHENVRYRTKKFTNLPFTFDLNTYDLFSDRAYATFDIYGNALLPKQRTLSYYYQSNYSSNYMNLNSFLGQFHYIGYQGKILGLEAGNIGASRSGLNLSGKGQVSLRMYNNTLSAMYVRNPNFTESAVLDGMAFCHSFSSRIFSIESYYLRTNQYVDKIKTNLFTTDMTFRFLKSHSLKLSGGYSMEELGVNPASIVKLNGYDYSVRYAGSIKKFEVGGYYSQSSPEYAVRNGMTTAAGNLGYIFNTRYSLVGGYNYFNYEPRIYYAGVPAIIQPRTNRIQYNLRFSINDKSSVYILNPFFHQYYSNQLNVVSRGFDFDYRFRSNTAIKFFSSVSAAYVRSLDHDSKDFFISQVRASVSYFNFSANIRYYYGPYFSQEQVQFLRTKVNPQKVYANLFYDYWFASNRALLKTNINYNYTSLFRRNMLSIRPEMFYYTNNNMRFSFYTRYLLMGEVQSSFSQQTSEYSPDYNYDSQIEFGLGAKLDINIPLTFSRFYEVEVITFRDVNANGVKESNEIGIGNMLIRLQMIQEPDSANERETVEDLAHEAITNAKGRAVFTKVPMGEYYINALPISSTGAWFDGKTIKVNLDKKRVIYIPLNKGARLSGGIMVDRDKYSRLLENIDFGSIRVTAIDSAGRTYSSLTDKEGRFSLFLPNGRYEVVMNEAPFGESFEFMQNNVSVMLSEEFENYNITFYLVERSRELRVKRFDGGGSVLDGDRYPIKRETRPPVTPVSPDPLPQDTNVVVDTAATGNNVVVDSTASGNVVPAEIYKAPLADESLIPVGEIIEKGTFYRVQFFAEPKERLKVTEVQSVPDYEQIKCIVTNESNYLYFSLPFEKQKKAQKYLDKLLSLGFSEASIAKFVDGNKVPF